MQVLCLSVFTSTVAHTQPFVKETNDGLLGENWYWWDSRLGKEEKWSTTINQEDS